MSPRGNTQQMLEAKVAQLEAMMKQAAKEKEEKEAKEEGAKEGPSGSAGLAALAWRGAAAAAGTAARGSMAAGAAAAAAGAGAEVEALSGSSEDDDDDDDEATQVGVSQEELESHGKPFLNAAERPLLRPSANEDADKGRRPAGQPGELAAMLAAMQAELAAVKDQNAKLIVQVGGALSTCESACERISPPPPRHLPTTSPPPPRHLTTISPPSPRLAARWVRIRSSSCWRRTECS